MVKDGELLAAVDAEFAVTGRGCDSWPDPHPHRPPLDEEYSRLLDPGKWLIIGARADAWLRAFASTGLAVVERDAGVEWRNPPGTDITRVDRAVPHVPDALCLVVARSRIDHVDDGGVTLGVGDPAVEAGWFPACGCDACDHGSQQELDQLDAHILGIVSGEFCLLTAGTRAITVFRDGSTSASGSVEDIDAVLADPRGWEELSGVSWLDGD